MERLFVQPSQSSGKVELSIRTGTRRDEALPSDEPVERERWQRFALVQRASWSKQYPEQPFLVELHPAIHPSCGFDCGTDQMFLLTLLCIRCVADAENTFWGRGRGGGRIELFNQRNPVKDKPPSSKRVAPYGKVTILFLYSQIIVMESQLERFAARNSQ